MFDPALDRDIRTAALNVDLQSQGRISYAEAYEFLTTNPQPSGVTVLNGGLSTHPPFDQDEPPAG